MKRQPTAAETEGFRRSLAENRKSVQSSEYAQKLQDANLTKRVEAGHIPYVWAEGEVLYDDPLKVIRVG